MFSLFFVFLQVSQSSVGHVVPPSMLWSLKMQNTTCWLCWYWAGVLDQLRFSPHVVYSRLLSSSLSLPRRRFSLLVSLNVLHGRVDTEARTSAAFLKTNSVYNYKGVCTAGTHSNCVGSPVIDCTLCKRVWATPPPLPNTAGRKPCVMRCNGS